MRRGDLGHARRSAGASRVRRNGRRLRQAAALAVAVLVGTTWLSGSAFASMEEPSETASPEPSSSPSSPSVSSTPSASPSDPSCSNSSGVISLPDPLPSDWSLPAWVDFSDGPRCAVLDVSALRVTKVTPPPEPEPSTLPDSQQLSAIQDELQGLRETFVFAAGLLIFCSAGLFMRSRRG